MKPQSFMRSGARKRDNIVMDGDGDYLLWTTD